MVRSEYATLQVGRAEKPHYITLTRTDALRLAIELHRAYLAALWNGVNEMTMRGKWSQPGVPQKSWICVGIEDLDEPAAICEMCEVQEIRYVHTMWHAEFDDELEVGCVCAGHMEGDREKPRERERILQRVAARKSRWLGRKGWKVSAKGNAFINVEGLNVVIFLIGDSWRIRITERASGNTRFGRRRYKSEDRAKLAAFDGMIFLRTQGWGN